MRPRAPTGGRSATSGRRLSRSAEFERVYRQGRSTANRHLVLYAFPNPSAPRPRLGLSVSRKVGGAVERNRVKRLLREAFAQAEHGLCPGQDIVVVARPEVGELAAREGLAGVDAALAELIDRARLRVGEPQVPGNETPVGNEAPAGDGTPAGNERPTGNEAPERES